jgi:hypothetical protein
MNRKGESNGGCLGCLGFIIVFWLLFYGGCAKIDHLVNVEIEAREHQLKQQTMVPQPVAPIASATPERAP